MPMLKMADSAVLREKPVISPGKASVTESTLPRIYEKILSRDRKPLLKGLFLGMFSLLSFFFRCLLFSTNYFLDPPGVCLIEKKVFHTLQRTRCIDLVRPARKSEGRTLRVMRDRSFYHPGYSTGMGRVGFFSSLFAN